MSLVTTHYWQELDLCDVLSVGQYIVSSVVSVTEVAKSKKVNLTIKPEVVNSNVKMQDVKKNMVSIKFDQNFLNLPIQGVNLQTQG